MKERGIRGKIKGFFKGENKTTEQTFQPESLTRMLMRRVHLTPEEKEHILELAKVVDSAHMVEFVEGKESPEKFVREGEKIVVAPTDINHVELAVALGMRLPEDAGRLIQVDKAIFIEEGSISLEIYSDNPGRLDTKALLTKIGTPANIKVFS